MNSQCHQANRKNQWIHWFSVQYPKLFNQKMSQKSKINEKSVRFWKNSTHSFYTTRDDCWVSGSVALWQASLYDCLSNCPKGISKFSKFSFFWYNFHLDIAVFCTKISTFFEKSQTHIFLFFARFFDFFKNLKFQIFRKFQIFFSVFLMFFLISKFLIFNKKSQNISKGYPWCIFSKYHWNRFFRGQLRWLSYLYCVIIRDHYRFTPPLIAN